MRKISDDTTIRHCERATAHSEKCGNVASGMLASRECAENPRGSWQRELQKGRLCPRPSERQGAVTLRVEGVIAT